MQMVWVQPVNHASVKWSVVPVLPYTGNGCRAAPPVPKSTTCCIALVTSSAMFAGITRLPVGELAALNNTCDGSRTDNTLRTGWWMPLLTMVPNALASDSGLTGMPNAYDGHTTCFRA